MAIAHEKARDLPSEHKMLECPPSLPGKSKDDNRWTTGDEREMPELRLTPSADGEVNLGIDDTAHTHVWNWRDKSTKEMETERYESINFKVQW